MLCLNQAIFLNKFSFQNIHSKEVTNHKDVANQYGSEILENSLTWKNTIESPAHVVTKLL